jgi:hypothetical protein
MKTSSGSVIISVSLVLGSLGLKGTDLVKYLKELLWPLSPQTEAEKAARNDGLNGVVTSLISYAVGFVSVEVVKHSAWGDQVVVGGHKLSSIDMGSSIVFGIVFAAVAGTLYDFKSALDNTGSAAKPKIVKSG